MRHIEHGADVLLTLSMLAGAGAGVAFALRNRGSGSEGQVSATPTQTPSAVELYGQAVATDMADLRDAWATAGAGADDLSGKGYHDCQFDMDCLAGEQVCVVGSSPNSPLPGYCVPK